jgi:ABC-2 type transport system permease protein
MPILPRDWTTSSVIKNFASLIVFGAFAIGAFFCAKIAITYMLDSARMGLFILHRFLSMLLFVFFLSINIGNIIVAYATLYRSQEVTYYLTKPVSHTNLFLVKFVDNFFYSSTIFFLMAFAVLLGYGTYFHMGWMFYLQTMVLMLLPFMLLSACLAVVMLMLLMLVADRIGVKKMIAILVAVYLGTLYVYFSLTNPVGLVSQVTKHYPNVDQYFGYLDPPIAKFLPNHWIAESLYWTIRGDDSFAFSYTILLVLFTIGVFTGMVILAKKLFYKSWLSSLHLQMAEESKFRFLRRWSLIHQPRFVNIQASVLLKKEVLLFIREPSQWIHLGIIVMLIVTFISSVAEINLKQSLPFLQTISYMVIFLFNAFLVASIALRFIYPSVSIESVNFWSVLSAPVERSKIFLLKFLLPVIPILVVSEALMLVSHHSLLQYPLLLEAASFLMVCVTFALAGLNLGAGVYFSDFREKNPIRVASSQGATLTFLLSIIYLVVVVTVLFIPLNNYFGFILRDAPLNVASFYFAVGIVAIISLSVGGVSLVAGNRALGRDY